AKLFASSLCQVFGKALQRAIPTAPMRITSSDGLEDGLMQRQLRLPTTFLEGYRHQCFVAGLTPRILPCVGEDEPLRLHELTVDAAQPMIGTLRRAHAEAVGASRAEIHRAGGQREVFRTPPVR